MVNEIVSHGIRSQTRHRTFSVNLRLGARVDHQPCSKILSNTHATCNQLLEGIPGVSRCHLTTERAETSLFWSFLFSLTVDLSRRSGCLRTLLAAGPGPAPSWVPTQDTMLSLVCSGDDPLCQSGCRSPRVRPWPNARDRLLLLLITCGLAVPGFRSPQMSTPWCARPCWGMRRRVREQQLLKGGIPSPIGAELAEINANA